MVKGPIPDFKTCSKRSQCIQHAPSLMSLQMCLTAFKEAYCHGNV